MPGVKNISYFFTLILEASPTLRAPKSLLARLARQAGIEGVSMNTLVVAFPAECLDRRETRQAARRNDRPHRAYLGLATGFRGKRRRCAFPRRPCRFPRFAVRPLPASVFILPGAAEHPK